MPAGGEPLIAVIPGGGANVLARSLGLPVDAAEAIRRLREALAAGRYRTIGLGLAGDRYFTFSAGLGWDAEVVGEVDRLRGEGHRESAALFLRTMVRTYYRGTDRRRPALTLERDGEPPVSDLFMTIITNRSPWTYLNSRPVLPVPHPDFSSGLDLLALRRLRLTRSSVRSARCCTSGAARRAAGTCCPSWVRKPSPCARPGRSHSRSTGNTWAKPRR